MKKTDIKKAAIKKWASSDASLCKRQYGFTLIELVAVIVLLGIIGTGVLSLIKTSFEGYNEVTRRIELADIGRFAIERVSRELRSALPGSVRVSALGRCVEFVPVIASSVYIDLPLPPSAVSNTITVANFINATDSDISRVAVYTLTPSNVYSPAVNSHMANVASIGDANSDTRIVTLTTANQFPLSSPGRRIFFVNQPVSFCVIAQQLNRYSGYVSSASQAVPPTGGQLLAEYIQLNDGGLIAPFKYSGDTLQRNGVVHLDFRFLAFNSANEWARFSHDISVRGTP